MSFPLHIFVYGTLLKGLSNHHLMKNCILIGTGRTVEQYGLFVADIPIVRSKEKLSYIFGEIYAVPDQATLDKMDKLENHPDYYDRRPIEVYLDVKTEGSDEVTQQRMIAELYFNDVERGEGCDVEFIPSGRFKES